jgi:hypothetical protein
MKLNEVLDAYGLTARYTPEAGPAPASMESAIEAIERMEAELGIETGEGGHE